MTRRNRLYLTVTVAFVGFLVGSGCSEMFSEQPTAPQQPAPKLILATYAPRQVLGADADGVTQFGDFDFSQLRPLTDAGINEIGAVIEFMTKDIERRYELRRDFVIAVKPYGIRYYHSIPTDDPYGVIPDGEELEDQNFVSGAMYLDEPYAHFHTPEGTPDLVSASQSYVSLVEGLLTEERRGPMCGGCGRNAPLLTANTIESITWYDLKAGADGFWVEGLGGSFLQQIHFFNEYFALGIPETPENYIRLIAAFERGAANHFNATWGYGVYSGTPVYLREIVLEGLYDRGATYFFFWANHADGTIANEEVVALAQHLRDYANTHTPSKTKATLAIVIPDGYYIPGGVYCSDELPDPEECIHGKGAKYSGGDLLWAMFPVVITEKTQEIANPQHEKIMRDLGNAIKDALAGGEEFDILVNDESLKPGYLDRYERVNWIGK